MQILQLIAQLTICIRKIQINKIYYEFDEKFRRQTYFDEKISTNFYGTFLRIWFIIFRFFYEKICPLKKVRLLIKIKPEVNFLGYQEFDEKFRRISTIFSKTYNLFFAWNIYYFNFLTFLFLINFYSNLCFIEVCYFLSFSFWIVHKISILISKKFSFK